MLFIKSLKQIRKNIDQELKNIYKVKVITTVYLYFIQALKIDCFALQINLMKIPYRLYKDGKLQKR